MITTLTTDDIGYAKSGKLEEGSYTVKEISASPGYAVDMTSYNIDVAADETSTAFLLL